MSRHLERIRGLVLDHLRGREASVLLFGSWARGDAGPASDVDVAIDPARPLPAGLLATLREALEESDVPFRVEIVDLTDADPAFRRRVIEEGVQWNG